MGSLPCFNLTIKENSEWFIVHWKSSRPPVFCSSVTGVFWSIDCKNLWWPGVSGGPPPAPSVCSILHTHLSPSYPGSPASSDGKIILLLPAINTSAIGGKLLKSWSTSLDYFAAEWFQSWASIVNFSQSTSALLCWDQSKLGSCLDPVVATCYSTTQAEIIKIGQRGSARTLQYWGRLTNMINTSSYS